MDKSGQEFSKIRSFFWPIRRCELFKFIPLLILFFIISFNYHLLKIAKDALIITAPKSGTETIPFLKVWAMLPTAIFFTFIFSRLAQKLNREKLFYSVISIFLAFFLIFLFILYPFKDQLALHQTADFLQEHLPKGFSGLIAIIRHWIFSLFYVIAESWSNIMLSLLLWGFANEVTSIEEAKRFYALFGIGINSAGILAGKCGTFLASSMHGKADQFISWDTTVYTFLILIIGICLLSMVIFKLMHLFVYVDRKKLTVKKREKISLKQTIQYITKSKYLLCIAAIVLSYNILINLTEVLWKSQIKELFPQPGEYTAYISKITFRIGLIATFSSYFLSGNIIRKFGWKFTAFLTPIIILITSIGFFGFLFLKEYTTLSFTLFGITPIAMTVFFGSIQNILSRSAKYTVFDETKEMAFIPLDPTTRIQGKSAIDGIGSRLGKSGSSLIMQFLLIFFGSTSSSSPLIFLIMLLIMPFWLISIRSLGKKFDTASKPVFNTSS